MPWVEIGEWGFDTDHVTTVHRYAVEDGSRSKFRKTVTDVLLCWGQTITLEADEALVFLDEWASLPEGGRRAWPTSVRPGRQTG
jgi:hypothetical protein